MPRSNRFVRGRARPVCPNPSAFTLIELLTAVTIVALLLALMLPAVSGARQSALTVKCAAQLHDVYLATVMYADDNNGFLPGPMYAGIAYARYGGLDFGSYMTRGASGRGYLKMSGSQSANGTTGPSVLPTLQCPANSMQIHYVANNEATTDPPRFFGYPFSGELPKKLERLQMRVQGSQAWLFQDVFWGNYVGNTMLVSPIPVHRGGINTTGLNGAVRYGKIEALPG